MEPIRILHENVIMDPGGIETQLMRIYRNIDRSKIQFDFLLHRTKKGIYDDEIHEMGGRIYYVEPFNPFHFFKYLRSMKDFFEHHHEYKIMIAHTELALCPLKTAANAKIPLRICYSHNGQFALNLKRCFMDFETLFLKKYCNEMFAVSKLAARYTFGEQAVNEGQVKVIKNGIIVEDYIYNESIRTHMREKLNLQSNYIIGHVGRFMKQKNHIFLLDVFANIVKECDNACLLLIGEGRLEKKIKKKINRLNLSDKVIILGRRKDVNDLMKAMDVLILPSKWEGFPNVAIEAQASALPVYMSDRITEEADFSQYSHRLPLNKGAEFWANTIISDSKKATERINMASIMIEKGFDVKITAKWYEEYYLNKIKKL